jgi:hypothetical protein
MQKLNSNSRRWTGNDRGSALITAVVLALIMVIAGMGYLWVTTNSLNKDSDAYTNDKALQAAESGAMLVSKYLMARTSASWTAALPAALADITINSLFVHVTLVTPVAGDATRVEVRAAAYTSSTTQNATTFKKRVVITLH